ncbi:MAG: histone deacetylase family protein [Candidatus Odinarchaeia archaeon]
MKVVYHEGYTQVYSSDPAAEAGRIESIYIKLKGLFDFVEPSSATEEDLALVHSMHHIEYVKRLNLYNVALLAVGGVIKASELALSGEPAFALIRPPGHHASADSCWGFCYFNNIAISVEKLRRTGKAKNVIIVDFDLHYGDGTANIFQNIPEVSYFHLPRGDRSIQLHALQEFLSGKSCDIVAVSAGFDRHVEDWGKMLETSDYTEIGKIIKEFAEEACEGRRYAVLEGGYNHRVLGDNVKAFLQGMK